jgi:S-adenosylmethionine decarboxylase
MHVGTEWLVDAAGCSPEALRSPDTLARLCNRVIADLGLTVVGEPVWHRFPGPGGVTGLILLSESHLSCHTYPEHGQATFNLHCCRARPRWRWEQELREALAATSILVREVVRGVP